MLAVAAFPRLPIAHYHVYQTTSTQDMARDLTRRAAHLPCLCTASTQTAGVGRRGAAWADGAGDILATYATACPAAPPAHFALIVAISMAERLTTLGAHGLMLKWPNDIFFVRKDNATKIGGILCEHAITPDGARLFIGVGLDRANNHPANLAMTGCTASWADTTCALAYALNEATRALAEGQTADILAEWPRWDFLRGKTVRFVERGVAFEGTACGIDGVGRLLVDMGAGALRAFVSIDNLTWQG